MKEISLHIMDIVQNSISADATLIEVSLEISMQNNRIAVVIRDNGRGMDKAMLESVTSPFTTTRTTRRVGLGIPLFKAGAEATGGSFCIDSKPGEGTVLEADYVLDHIDRPPIGDFAGTMHMLIVCNPNIDFVVDLCYEGENDTLDTQQVRQVLGEDVPLNTPDVSIWLKDNLDELFKPEYAKI